MVLSLDVMFWILRIIAALTDTMAIDFMIKPIDMNMEIIMIFVALVSFVLIAKRKFLGAIIYMIGYFGYFGVALVTNLQKMTTTGGSVNDYGTVMFSLVGVALPIFTFLDLLLDKNRQLHPTDKKTDWFYKDEKYDMKKDERADKNNYRTL
jgi:hypothetical protein